MVENYFDSKDFWITTMSGLGIAIILITVDLIKDLANKNLNSWIVNLAALIVLVLVFIYSGIKYDYFKNAVHEISSAKRK